MKRFSVKVMVLAVMMLVMCAEAFAAVEINATNFPDATFREYVRASFDVNNDGTLTDNEISNATEIDVSNMSISSLRGIEYLTSLKTLNCANNQLTELDLSKNATLTEISCENNRLTKLEVRGCVGLTNLTCDNNQLTRLDFNGVNRVKYLSCEHNKLSTLDVISIGNLTYLNCSDNKLTYLDLEKHHGLQVLNCENNDLAILKLSGGSLTHLTCHYNNLSSLYLKWASWLELLYCDFTIQNTGNAFEFNFSDFKAAFELVGNLDTSLAFSAIATDGSIISTSTASSESEKATVDESSGIMHFTNPRAKTLSYLSFTIADSPSSSRPSISTRIYLRDTSSARSPIITTRDLPDGVKGVSYDATLEALGTKPITWSIIDGLLPDGLSLDSTGTISGTPTSPGAFTFTVQAANSAGSSTKLFSIVVPFSTIRPPKITTGLLPEGFIDSPYGFKFTASGTTPLTWLLSDDASLPDGLTFTKTGYLYGTPTSSDTYTLTVRASNDAGIDSADFILKISTSPLRTRPAVMTKDPTPATTGEAYICQLMALGTPPFTWTLNSKLPTGLSMTDSGLITGTPTKAGVKELVLTVSNDYGKEKRTLVLNVYDLPQITTSELKNPTVGKKYKSAVKGKGTKTLVWELEGNLPRGITMFDADKAKITGSPTVNDKVMIRVTLSNAAGEVSRVYRLSVKADAPTIKPSQLKDATYGKSYTAALKLKSTAPIKVIISGDLPEGLSFNSESNTFTGTPREVCTNVPITVYAVNIGGVMEQKYSLTVRDTVAKTNSTRTSDSTAGTKSIAIVGSVTETTSLTQNISRKTSDQTSEESITNLHDVNVQYLADITEGYIIVAELGTISVDESGMYDFSFKLSDDVQTGKELFYLSGSSEPLDDDIAELFDETGAETSTVPASREVTMSVWLNEGITYSPALAISH